MSTPSGGREQVNLVLGRASPVARRLRIAERVTGKSRTHIARSVLEMFLDAWLAVELSQQRLLESVRTGALQRLVDPATPSLAPVGPSGADSAGAVEAFGYLSYLAAARRLLEAAEGSREWEQAAEAVAEAFARDQGHTRQGRGGSLAAVRARLRERAAGTAANR